MDANKSVIDTWLNPGQKIYMLVDKGSSSPGGWATPSQFNSVEEARQKLSLLPEFKSNDKCCDIVTFEVKSPIPVREGWVGPLRSQQTGQSFNGGAKQWEFLISKYDTNMENFLQLVPGSRKNLK